VRSAAAPAGSPDAAASPELAALHGSDLSADAHDLAREGRLLLDRGQPEAAIGLFTQALTLDPTHLAAYRGLADTCRRAGDLACAERAYRGLARVVHWREKEEARLR